MPFVRGFLRVLKRRDRWGRPVDPDYGIDEGDLEAGGGEGEAPGQGLPGFPGRPGHGLPPSWGGEHRPVQPLPRPPWERPHWPPGPTDPDFGIPEEGGGEDAGQLPGEIDPTDPPDEIPAPPIELPPGSIWPPLPPSAPPGTHWYLMYISGVGHRYGKFVVPETPPQRPHPPAGGIGGRPPERPPGTPVR
jgi:hypothetical protein